MARLKARLHRSARAAVVAVLTAAALAMPASATPFGPGRVEGPHKVAPVRPGFFGLGMEAYRDQWPNLDVGMVRLSSIWAAVERSRGRYDWAILDGRVARSEELGARPLLIVQATPRFYALGPQPATPGSAPDLDGYRTFVEALVARYGDRVDYQVWNEPNVEQFFTGTPAHAAEMTRILARIVRTQAPGASAVAPSFPLRGDNPAFRKWFRSYLRQKVGPRAQPVTRFFDAASISAYPMPDEDPEDGLAITQYARRVLARHGFHGPLWATEINYGANGGAPTKRIPVRRQVSNVVRTYVLHATLGADRVFWYSWNPDPTVNTQLQDGNGNLTPAGDAYGVVQDWLLGTRPLGCETTEGVSTCGFRVGGGVKRYVSWTRSGRIRPLVAPKGAVSLAYPTGKTRGLKPGRKLHVGVTPVMIEVQPAR